MKKKLVSVLLVAAMGASVLAGCGSRSVKEDGGEKKSESSGNNGSGVLSWILSG